MEEMCVVEDPNAEKSVADELSIRSALRIYGFRDKDLDRIPTGVLDDFKDMVSNNQTAVVVTFLTELGLDLKARIQLIKGLASLTESAMDAEERQPKFLSYMPVWNLIDDIFFDKPPPNEMIKEILNLIGIMGALLFSLVCSIYVGLDPEKIDAMTKNWKVIFSPTFFYLLCRVGPPDISPHLKTPQTHTTGSRPHRCRPQRPSGGTSQWLHGLRCVWYRALICLHPFSSFA